MATRTLENGIIVESEYGMNDTLRYGKSSVSLLPTGGCMDDEKGAWIEPGYTVSKINLNTQAEGRALFQHIIAQAAGKPITASVEYDFYENLPEVEGEDFGLSDFLNSMGFGDYQEYDGIGFRMIRKA